MVSINMNIVKIASFVWVLMVSQCIGAQIFDRMFSNTGYGVSQPQLESQRVAGVSRDPATGTLGVNIPFFYDMTKNGNNMGINVLSGLVKIERGQEATRSGLQGPRPLSVRVFGIPVFERGTRFNGGLPEPVNPEANVPEEMPVPNMPIPSLPEGPDGNLDP